jgi:hypothetical protein
MTRRLAFALCDLAIIVLPRGRRVWGEAMQAELSYVTGGPAAFAHATGCVVAAAKVRMADVESRFAAGLGSLALLSVAFGIYHIGCASRGLDVMLGRPDGFLAGLMRSGRATPELIASYHQAMPFVVACLFALGFAHLTGSYFLLRREWHRFLLAWCGALLAAMAAVTVQLLVVWSSDGLPSEFYALLIQAVALPMLLLWSNGRQRQTRRTE